MNPFLRTLIEQANSPVKHESGGLTNEALRAIETMKGRFTVATVTELLDGLEAINRSAWDDDDDLWLKLRDIARTTDRLLERLNTS